MTHYHFNYCSTSILKCCVVLVATFCFFLPQRLHAQDNRVGDAFMTCSAPFNTDFVLARFSVQDVANQPVDTWWNAPPVSHGPNDIWTAGNLGQVYGIATDPYLNVYVSASAVWGPVTYTAAEATTIYRIDPAGNITPLVTGIPSGQSSVWNGVSMQMQHASLGNLCYDNFHHQLLVTAFDDGRIYRIDPSTGAQLGSFDPLMPDNGMPGDGWAPLGERPWGIACHGTDSSDVIVYYGIWSEDHRGGGGGGTAGPNTVRSISLTDQGDFDLGTDALVFTNNNVPNSFRSSPIADIAVSPSGASVYLAERTMIGEFKETFATSSSWAHRARLIELSGGGSNSTAFGVGRLGNGNNNRQNGTGGVDWGLMDLNQNDNDPGLCDSIIWVGASPVNLGNNTSTVYGFHSIPTVGGGVEDGVWVDANSIASGTDKGTLGDVELIKNCCDFLDVIAEADSCCDDTCCFKLSFVNNYATDFYGAIEMTLLDFGQPGFQSTMTTNVLDNDWSVFGFTQTYAVVGMANGGFIPSGTSKDAIEVCFEGALDGQYALEVQWLDGDRDTLCTDTIWFDCSPDFNCIELVKDSTFCKGTEFGYAIWVENHSNFTFQSIDVIPSDPTFTVSPDPIVLNGLPYPPLPPGQVGGPYFLNVTGPAVIPGEKFCYILSAHDTEDPETAPNCCTDSIEYCTEIPVCSPCDSVDAYVTGDVYTCTFELHLVNNHDNMTFTEVETELLAGATFTSAVPQTGWSIDVQPGFSEIHWETNPSGFIPYGDNYVGDIMVSGPNGSPYQMVVRWMIDDSIACEDTLILECKEECVALVEDTVWCGKGGEVLYDFTIYNNSSSPAFTFQRIFIDILNGYPGVFTPNEWNNVLIPPGTQWSPPTPVEITGANPGDEICFIIVAHDHPVPSGTHLNCCPSDTICITVPRCEQPCLPTIDVIGDSVLCGGESTILCGLPCGQCRESMWMQWTGPNGFTSNANCPIVTDPGVYCLTVWCDGVPQGPVCQTIYASLPGFNGITGTPNSPDCVGDQVTLTADVCCDRPTFLWSNGATTQSITVTTQVGINTYSVTVWCDKQIFAAGTSWNGQFCEVKKQASAEVPEEALLEAFPNPFSSNATFRFSLPEADRGTLQLYGADGRVVEVLYDGDIAAGASVEGQITGAELAEGIYYLRLQTQSGKVMARRLVLMK